LWEDEHSKVGLEQQYFSLPESGVRYTVWSDESRALS